jgi:hypothetical protein
MAYDFHPDAKRELEDAVAYYDNISRELGDAFIEEVEETLDRIEKFPRSMAPAIQEYQAMSDS